MRVLLAHPGTQHSPQLARELHRHGLLDSFWTGLAFPHPGPGATAAAGLSRLPGLHGMASRILRGVPARLVHTQPGLELLALWRLRRGGASQVVLHDRNRDFQLAIPDAALIRSDAIIGFDTSSWILAERCQQLGRPLYLDRTTPHPAARARIMRAFLRRYPAWAGPEVQRPPALVRAEETEHALARRIVVAGSFARDNLIAEGVEAARIFVNPYGVNWAHFGGTDPQPAARPARPLRFLFVGSVTAQKGVPLLLDAWRALVPCDAELWLAGSIDPRLRPLLPELPGLRLLGQMPKAALASLYAACDVLVLPSLFDGFGLVILEALAAGLPVIATPHTGAADLPPDPALGRLVQAGSLEELVSAMREYLASPPLRSAVFAAAAGLRSTFSWSAYGDRWAGLLRES